MEGVISLVMGCVTQNTQQTVAARENLVNKIEATLMAKFDKKISL
jgi:hypothetical protein